jgi:hypothetical protein
MCKGLLACLLLYHHSLYTLKSIDWISSNSPPPRPASMRGEEESERDRYSLILHKCHILPACSTAYTLSLSLSRKVLIRLLVNFSIAPLASAPFSVYIALVRKILFLHRSLLSEVDMRWDEMNGEESFRREQTLREIDVRKVLCVCQWVLLWGSDKIYSDLLNFSKKSELTYSPSLLFY